MKWRPTIIEYFALELELALLHGSGTPTQKVCMRDLEHR